MTKENRKIYGKLWKEGKVKAPCFEQYYKENKAEIDAELAVPEDKPKIKDKKTSKEF